MSHLSSSAIMLRAIDHGDYDKIVTCFTLEQGKISVIAKGAKKSMKRFAGVLEIFSLLNIVWSYGRGRGLPILTEAAVVRPFEQIRTSIIRTAYASYWCELVSLWMEEGQKQPGVYHLLEYLLDRLNSGGLSEPILHVTFQLHFMATSGFSPGLVRCTICGTSVEDFQRAAVTFDVRRGGVVCEKCSQGRGPLVLSKGTAKLLSWMLKAPLQKIERLRFSEQALQESLRMLGAFVPYHLGKETKSLKFLKQLDTRLRAPG
jgi:DNA repair protein RecO (recombination protein O)